MATARQQLLALRAAAGAAVLARLLVVVWRTRGLVVRPVAELARSLSQLDRSDLLQPPVARSHDELDRLANAMKGFRHHLAHTLTVVRAHAEHVASARSQIAMGNKDLKGSPAKVAWHFAGSPQGTAGLGRRGALTRNRRWAAPRVLIPLGGRRQRRLGRSQPLVKSLVSQSVEQSAGVTQVGQAVTQMDQATRQNAALMEGMEGAPRQPRT